MLKRLKTAYHQIVQPILYFWALVYLLTSTLFFNYQPLAAWWLGRGMILINYNRFGENVFEIFMCTSGTIAILIFVKENFHRFVDWYSLWRLMRNVKKHSELLGRY